MLRCVPCDVRSLKNIKKVHKNETEKHGKEQKNTKKEGNWTWLYLIFDIHNLISKYINIADGLPVHPFLYRLL